MQDLGSVAAYPRLSSRGCEGHLGVPSSASLREGPGQACSRMWGLSLCRWLWSSEGAPWLPTCGTQRGWSAVDDHPLCMDPTSTRSLEKSGEHLWGLLHNSGHPERPQRQRRACPGLALPSRVTPGGQACSLCGWEGKTLRLCGFLSAPSAGPFCSRSNSLPCGTDRESAKCLHQPAWPTPAHGSTFFCIYNASSPLGKEGERWMINHKGTDVLCRVLMDCW